MIRFNVLIYWYCHFVRTTVDNSTVINFPELFCHFLNGIFISSDICKRRY